MSAVTTALFISVILAATPAFAQKTPSPDIIIKRQDQNGDSRISKREWRGPPSRFGVLDLNSDGYLTKSELQEGIAAAQAARVLLRLLNNLFWFFGLVLARFSRTAQSATVWAN